MKLTLAHALLLSIAMLCGTAIICAAILRPREEPQHSYVTLSYSRTYNSQSTRTEMVYRIDRRTGKATFVVSSIPPFAK